MKFMSAWKTYLWLTFIGLMASAVNWSKIVHDENGGLRWGTIAHPELVTQVRARLSVLGG